MLDEWVDARKKVATDGETSFFVSRTGSALSSRSVDLAVRRVAARARLELSAHVLRHTFVTGLVRAGIIFALFDLLGLQFAPRLAAFRTPSYGSPAPRTKAGRPTAQEPSQARPDPSPVG